MIIQSHFRLISTAKPGQEAPDVRLRVDRHRDPGGLGGLRQHRYGSFSQVSAGAVVSVFRQIRDMSIYKPLSN